MSFPCLHLLISLQIVCTPFLLPLYYPFPPYILFISFQSSSDLYTPFFLLSSFPLSLSYVLFISFPHPLPPLPPSESLVLVDVYPIWSTIPEVGSVPLSQLITLCSAVIVCLSFKSIVNWIYCISFLLPLLFPRYLPFFYIFSSFHYSLLLLLILSLTFLFFLILIHLVVPLFPYSWFLFHILFAALTILLVLTLLSHPLFI